MARPWMRVARADRWRSHRRVGPATAGAGEGGGERCAVHGLHLLRRAAAAALLFGLPLRRHLRRFGALKCCRPRRGDRGEWISGGDGGVGDREGEERAVPVMEQGSRERAAGRRSSRGAEEKQRRERLGGGGGC
jgi:hypothetical protein